MKMSVLFLGSVLFFIVLDLLWFQIAGNFFKSQIGSIARLSEDGSWNVRIGPALLVYVVMAVGLLLFVLPLAGSISHAFVLGAVFGLVAYGIYDLTNLATLSAWTVRFAAVDMAWGSLLCGLASSAVYYASRLSFFT